jgi:hypothetical protein
MTPSLPKWGLGSSSRLPKLQSSIAGVKTPRIMVFFITLERYRSVDVENGLAWAIWTSTSQVMTKKNRESNWQFDSWPLKDESRPDPICARELQHTVGKLSTKATIFLKTSLRSKVCTKSYAPSKSRESHLLEFRDFHLGVPGQKAIRMWPPWRTTKYIIWGKVVASPRSGPWWILWVQSRP